jgi:YVTN family beta-propeller protein
MNARDLARGTVVLHYRIEAILGRGGVGVVYLAEDLRLKRMVALKVLSPRLADDERFRERFLSESELAASLDHANVIPVYEAGEADGSLYIAMRYVEGADLKAHLGEGPLAREQVVALAEQIGGALDAAHEHGLLHGDVKSSNVLIDGRGHAYLADFGLTRRLGGARHSEGGAQLMGTIDYVAPELIRGDEIDGRADIYSLGCLLFECLVGQRPFERSNDAAVLYAHLEDDPPSAGGPADAVIARALAKSPDDRYQTCAELSAATREALGVSTTTSRRPLVVGAAAAVAAAGAAFLALILVRGGPPAPHGELLRIDPSDNAVTRSASVGTEPTSIATEPGSVWITTLGDSSVWRINAHSGSSVRIAMGGSPIGIAVSGGTAYVANTPAGEFYGAGDVTRIAGEAGAATDSVTTNGAYAVASGPGGVWVARPQGVARLASISAFSGKLADRISQPCCTDAASPGIAVGAGGVWMLDDAIGRRLWRFQPGRQRAVATIPLGFVPAAVTASSNAVWVTAQLDDEVARIDPATNRIVKIVKVGREPQGIAVGAGAVWTANAIDRTVSRIDPATNRVTATITLHRSPAAIAVGDGKVWVAVDAS